MPKLLVSDSGKVLVDPDGKLGDKNCGCCTTCPPPDRATSLSLSVAASGVWLMGTQGQCIEDGGIGNLDVSGSCSGTDPEFDTSGWFEITLGFPIVPPEGEDSSAIYCFSSRPVPCTVELCGSCPVLCPPGQQNGCLEASGGSFVAVGKSENTGLWYWYPLIGFSGTLCDTGGAAFQDQYPFWRVGPTIIGATVTAATHLSGIGSVDVSWSATFS